MSATTTPRSKISAARSGDRSYDAFLSYSHAADGRLAPALQAGLQSLAKPWYRRRALRVFRDKTSLSASPELWPAIEGALSQARYFVLLASPEAAASHWVEQEVRWWHAHRGHNTVLIALTDGELRWDAASRDFDAPSAIPPGLRGWFPVEPLWVDLRWARDERDVSMRNPRFRDSVGEVAASLHGVPKDELIGEDISQHRRTLQLARGAVALLVLLLAGAVVGGVVALVQRNRAVSNEQTAESRELATRAMAVLRSDPELAALLAIEAFERKPTEQAEVALRRAVLATPHDILPAGSSMAVSSSGERMASASDGTIRVWKARGERTPQLLRGKGTVVALAFSPDGRRLASARFDGGLRVDDLVTTEQIVLEKGSEPSDVAFSSDGQRLASAGFRRVRVWDIGGRRRPIDLHPALKGSFTLESFSAVAFSPDGSRVAAVREDSTIHIWRSDGRGRPVLVIGPPLLRGPKAESPVNTLGDIAFSADGERVIVLGRSGIVHIWQADGGAGSTVAEGPRGTDSIGISGDGRRIASARPDGTVQIWNLAGPRNVAVLGTHSGGGVSAAVFTDDGERVISAGSDLRIWDVRARAPVVLNKHDHYLTWDLAISPNGSWLASSGDDPVVRLWRVGDGATPRLLRGHRGEVRSVTFSADGTRLASAGADGTVRIWRIPGGQEHDVLGGRAAGFLHDVAFSADGAKVASAGADGLVRVRSVDRRSKPMLLRGHRGEVRAVTFSPDGAWLASAGDDGTVRRWPIQGGESAVLGRFHESPEELTFSPDSTRVGLATSSAVQLFEVRRNGSPEILGGGGTILAMAFISDGSGVISVGDDENLRLWSPSGLVEGVIRTPPLYVTADAEIGHKGQVATSAEPNFLHVWRCPACRPIEDVLELVRARATRTMTPEERSIYLHEPSPG